MHTFSFTHTNQAPFLPPLSFLHTQIIHDIDNSFIFPYPDEIVLVIIYAF